MLNTIIFGSQRKGAIMPLFAFLLPVLLILCGFAINLAYMQQVSTELKVATDAAAHASGRAMSLKQTTGAAIAQAQLTAQTNLVGGKVLSVDDLQIVFGNSVRANNGYGMYQFSEVPKAQVDNRSQRATSVGVISSIQLPLVFNVMNQEYFGGNMTAFTARRRSIATQVDRDIALVLDRSGSMLLFKDEDLLTNTIYTLYNSWEQINEPGYWKYGYWQKNGTNNWQWKGYYRPSDANNSWEVRNWNDKYWQDGDSYWTRKIDYNEYRNATKYLYDRSYSDNVIYQLERYVNPNHTLGDSFSSGEHGQLTTEMAQYTRDWEYVSGAARYSRWYFLDLGVTKFLDILDFTDQEERVALVTFSNSSRLDYKLQEDYQKIRTKVSGIKPYGGTAIGDGLLKGLPPIIDGSLARPFAAKTIVVLTDGDNNAGKDPIKAAQQIVKSNNVIIHTVTFTQGVQQKAMQDVAEIGMGRHYHANKGEDLVEIFEEIANNLPTILTE